MPDGLDSIALADSLETRRLETLYRYGVLDTGPEESFDRITRLAKSVLQVDIAAVSLVDRDRQWFKSRQGTDLCETSRDVSFCSHAIRDLAPLIVPDTLMDARFAENPLVTGAPWIRFYLGVPLRMPDGQTIGTLCAIDRRPRNTTPDQVAVMQDLARLVVDELELRQLATTDDLTGALTRRAFMMNANNAVAKAARYNHPISLVTLDIDHFKLINDTHGHGVGDEVLRRVASSCRSELRSFDEFGRIGGEEFAIVLPEQDAARATYVAERLRKRIAATPMPGRTGTLRVTASFGVAERALHGNTAEMLAEADAALYLAKQSGRNQTVAAPPAVEDEVLGRAMAPTLRF